METQEIPDKLRILNLEDSPADTELIKHAIDSMSMDYELIRVDSKVKYIEKCKAAEFDLILSDHKLPGFNGIEALKIALDLCPGIPFIFVSGTIGEEIAIEAMKHGATDYILKKNLNKIPIAIKRALKELKENKKRIFAEMQLVHINNVLNSIRNVNQLIVKAKDKIQLLNEAVNLITEYKGYKHAIIGLLGENNEVVHYSFSGLDEYVEDFKRGSDIGLSLCWENTGKYKNSDIYLPGNECESCCLHSYSNSGYRSISSRLEHEGNNYGFITISVPEEFIDDEQELSLFREMRGDIAFAIYSLNLKEEQEKAFLMLEESEEKYRRLVENMMEGVTVVDVNEKILFINETALEIFGHSREKMLGKPLTEFTPESEHKILQQSTKEKLEGQTSSYLLKIKKKNDEERYLRVNSSPLFEKNGSYYGSLGVYHDITEPIEFRAKLERSEQRFRKIFEDSPNGILIFDEDGSLIDVNKEFYNILGISPDEPNDFNSYNIFNDTNIEDLELSELKQGESIVFQLHCSPEFDRNCFNLSNSVRNLYLSVKVTPLDILGEGRVEAYMMIVDDISKLKETEVDLIHSKERAERLNRLKSIFLANMSHEMRTPMVGILGFSEILLKEAQPEETREIAEIIYNSGKRLMDTLNLVLDLTKIESDKQEMNIEIVNPMFVIMDAIRLYDKFALEKGIELTAEIQDDSLRCELDENIIYKIVYNLINNAIKFTDNGYVKVILDKELQGDELWMVIKVEDSGVGIDEEYIGVIFDEFRQVSEGINRSYEGTGLGLTITKHLVEILGGNISVTSRLGKGSTFTVKFKAINKAEINEPKGPEQKVKTKINLLYKEESRSDLSIMLAEDDEVNKKLMNRYLEEFGDVTHVYNGEDALSLTSANKYDLIILDINLGKGIDGVETMLQIKKQGNNPNARYLALTAYAMKGDSEEFLEAGFDYYISKPFSRNDFLELVNKLAEKS